MIKINMKTAKTNNDAMIPARALFLVVPDLLIFSSFSSGVSLHKAAIPKPIPAIANNGVSIPQIIPKIIIAAFPIPETNHTAAVQNPNNPLNEDIRDNQDPFSFLFI